MSEHKDITDPKIRDAKRKEYQRTKGLYLNARLIGWKENRGKGLNILVADRATRRNQARADGWLREWSDMKNRVMSRNYGGAHVVPYPLRTTLATKVGAASDGRTATRARG